MEEREGKYARKKKKEQKFFFRSAIVALPGQILPNQIIRALSIILFNINSIIIFVHDLFFLYISRLFSPILSLLVVFRFDVALFAVPLLLRILSPTLLKFDTPFTCAMAKNPSNFSSSIEIFHMQLGLFMCCFTVPRDLFHFPYIGPRQSEINLVILRSPRPLPPPARPCYTLIDLCERQYSTLLRHSAESEMK